MHRNLDSVLARVTAACDATVWNVEKLRHGARHKVQLRQVDVDNVLQSALHLWTL